LREGDGCFLCSVHQPSVGGDVKACGDVDEQ
jgi:hypothetical protein